MYSSDFLIENISESLDVLYHLDIGGKSEVFNIIAMRAKLLINTNPALYKPVASVPFIQVSITIPILIYAVLNNIFIPKGRLFLNRKRQNIISFSILILPTFFEYMTICLFFTILRFMKVWSELAKFIKKNPPDLKSLKGFHSYEVKMGEHSFTFYTMLGNQEPEDLAELGESQTRHRPILKDFNIKNCHGKMCGNYSEEFTSIVWWLKKGNCMICFNLQGFGMPSDEVKSDISNIFENLKYVDKAE